MGRGQKPLKSGHFSVNPMYSYVNPVFLYVNPMLNS